MKPLFQTKELKFIDKISYPDICIMEDKVTFIVGKSGTGKSTLLKLMNGTVSSSAGSILYKNQDINHMDTITLRKEVLLVSQNVHLFSGTVMDNVREYYEYLSLTPPKKEAFHCFSSMCCANFDDEHLCQDMSGGERQRVYLAIFLSLKPKVLLLDEPTAALDSENSIRCMEQIISYCKQNHITVICVCHNPQLVEHFAEVTIDLEKRL